MSTGRTAHARARQQRLRTTDSPVRQSPRSDVPDAKGGVRQVVLRSLDLDSDPQTMFVQEVRYKDDPPVPGDLEAVGPDIQAYPFTGWTYEMYNAQNLMRRHADAADPEVFGTNVHTSLLFPDKTLLILPKIIAGMGATAPNAETT
jgi:hypothetical protein